MLDFVITIIAFLVALGILVSVHEFGHFWVARRMGVKVLRFSVGFGKPLWSYQKTPESTEYALAAIPLGGYVKMLDEREGEVLPEERHLAFNTQHVSKRIAIVAAGPIFNFILAIFLYAIVAMVGISDVKPIVGEVTPDTIAARAGLQYEDQILAVNDKTVRTWTQARLALMEQALNEDVIRLDIQRNQQKKRVQLELQGQKLLKDNQDVIEKLGISAYLPKTLKPVVGGLLASYPAEKAGLQLGDLIIAVDDNAVTTWQEWADYVRARPEQLITLQVQRDGTIFNTQIRPIRKTEGEESFGLVGVQYQSPVLEQIQYPFFAAIHHAAVKTWDMSVLMLKMLAKLIVGDVSTKNISGPITIAEYAGKTASLDLRYYIDFIAIISISLGVLNLLPIPLLDGGHLLYYFVEAVRGKPVSERVQLIAQQFGIVILGMLMLLAFYNDINRLLQ